MDNNKPKSRKTLYRLILIVGICLIIVGGISLGIGFSTFFSDPFGTSFNMIGLAFGFLIPGTLLTMIGGCLNFYKAVDESMSTHLDDGSDRQYDEYGRVIKKKSRSSAGENIIRIKCTLCGELNDQDATYCDNCGQRL